MRRSGADGATTRLRRVSRVRQRGDREGAGVVKEAGLKRMNETKKLRDSLLKRAERHSEETRHEGRRAPLELLGLRDSRERDEAVEREIAAVDPFRVRRTGALIEGGKATLTERGAL